MTDILILIIGIIFIFLSVIGSIIPILPGPPIGFAGLFILRYSAFVGENRIDAYDKLLWVFAIIVVVITLLDYVVPVWGTKKFGGSKAGMLGAGLGIIAGLFFSPAGIIIGPFLGAVIGELIAGKEKKIALKSGVGSFFGFITGVLLKLIVSVLMGFYFIKELLVN